jgi:hypothetical protein
MNEVDLLKSRVDILYTELDSQIETVAENMSINSSDLENELCKHSSLVTYIAPKVTRLEMLSADIKNTLDVKKASAFMEAKLSTEKITEGLAKACVDQNEEVIELKGLYAKAEALHNCWKNLLTAYNQRTYILTSLVKLAIMERSTLVTPTDDVRDYNEQLANVTPQARMDQQVKNAMRPVHEGLDIERRRNIIQNLGKKGK